MGQSSSTTAGGAPARRRTFSSRSAATSTLSASFSDWRRADSARSASAIPNRPSEAG